LCENSGYQGADYKECYYIGCDAVFSSRNLPAFWRNAFSFPSSVLRIETGLCFETALNRRAMGFAGKSVNFYQNINLLISLPVGSSSSWLILAKS
jgi:hypothetical protein